MATNSSTLGYLAPSTSVDYDDELDDILHEAIVGITGVSGDLVRPRWQPEPPQQPAFDVNWIAFGVTRGPADTFAYTKTDPAGQGAQVVERDEQIIALHSFYGPGGMNILARFRDGLMVEQNRDALASHGIKLVEVQEPSHLPALFKERWVKRVDVTVIYRRRTSRTYPVLTIEIGHVELNNERYVTTIDINQ